MISRILTTLGFAVLLVGTVYLLSPYAKLSALKGVLRYGHDVPAHTLVDIPALTASLRSELSRHPLLTAGIGDAELTQILTTLATPQGVAFIATSGLTDLRKAAHIVSTQPPTTIAIAHTSYCSLTCFTFEGPSGVKFYFTPGPLRWRIRRVILPA